MIYFRFIIIVWLGSWPGFLYSGEVNRSLELSNGEVINIERIDKVWAGGSNEWVLLVTYGVKSIDDIPSLTKRAVLIFPYFQSIADENEIEHVGIKASVVVESYSIGIVTTTDRKGVFHRLS